MLLFSNQLNIIHEVYQKFRGGFISANDAKIFLSPKMFESYSDSNFKLTVIWMNFKYNPTSIVNLLEMLNVLDKDKKMEVKKLKSDIQARDYLLNKDIESNWKDPYKAYKNNDMSVFGLNHYYLVNSHNSHGIKGRLMKRELSKVKTFLSFFNKEGENE